MLMNEDELTIEGKDLDDCKRKLFALYGNAYTPREIKTIPKPGWFGFRQKSCVKVWYTVKNSLLDKDVSEASRPQGNYVVQDAYKPTRYSSDVLNSDFVKNRDDIIRQTSGVSGEASVSNFIQVAQMQKDMKSQFSELDEKLNLLVEKGNATDAHPSITKIVSMLEDNDFSADFVKQIKARLTEELTLRELDDFDEVQKTVVDWIGNQIRISSPKGMRKPNIIIIVGPTGVGKTTTIAKIAAQTLISATQEKKPKPSIHMLTIDKMRVGAKEQLQKYADSMGLPFYSAETSEEVLKVYGSIKNNADYLLIDTSGFSPNDSENIGKMRKILNVHELDADVYLAFDATKTASTIKSIMQNFEPFGYDSVIVTKCDETDKFGGVLSAVIEKNKSIAFIADGQKAHTNLSRATKQYFLTRLYKFKIDSEHLDDLFPEEK